MPLVSNSPMITTNVDLIRIIESVERWQMKESIVEFGFMRVLRQSEVVPTRQQVLFSRERLSSVC